MASNYNISVHRGVDYETSITLKDSNGDAINVTNWTFKAEIRRDATTDVEATFTITKTNASGGVIKLALTDTETQGLPVGKLNYDLMAKNSSGVITRLIEGTITVEASITSTSGM